MDLLDGFLAVKQGRSLLQTETLCFDDEKVTEQQLENEPAAVENLQ
jgi:hypothetical protein